MRLRGGSNTTLFTILIVQKEDDPNWSNLSGVRLFLIILTVSQLINEAWR